MKTNTLQEYVRLHRALIVERSSIQQRLQQINEALGEMKATGADAPARAMTPTPAATHAQSKAAGSRSKKRRMSAEGKARIAEAARKRWAAAKAAGKSRL